MHKVISGRVRGLMTALAHLASVKPRHRRWIPMVAGLAIAAGPVIASAPSASAGTGTLCNLAACGKDEPVTPASTPASTYLAAWMPLMKAQEPLVEAAQRIIAARGSGFTSASISVPDQMVTVYWKGEPARVARVMAQIRATGIKVVVHPARYSKAEQQARAQRIMAMAGQYRAKAEIVGVVLPGDGNGLTVKVQRTATAPAMTRLQEQAARDFRPDVHVVAGSAPTPTNRFDDQVPHWAGARMIEQYTGVQCTSGWPIQRISDGRTFIITANHCHGTTWWAPDTPGYGSADANWKFGDVWASDTEQDAEIIRSFVLGPQQGETYDGGVAPGTDSSLPIANANYLQIPGMSVCQSGSMTGVHCGLIVGNEQEADQIPGENYYSVESVINAQSNVNTCNGITWGRGDSGGPIFTCAVPELAQWL